MPKSVQDYLKEPYSRILIPDELGGYSAEILEFPGCFAEGETADETMQALDRAAESWIEAALYQGQEIPSPFINQGYSGKIALRLPRSLHRQATQFAERDGTSLNQFLVSAISARVGAEEFYNRLATQMLKKLEDQLSATANRVMNIAFVNLRINSPQLAANSAMEIQMEPPPVWPDYILSQAATSTAPIPLEMVKHG
jgi:predicted RNase H-like HicB family nuclease